MSAIAGVTNIIIFFRNANTCPLCEKNRANSPSVSSAGYTIKKWIARQTRFWLFSRKSVHHGWMTYAFLTDYAFVGTPGEGGRRRFTATAGRAGPYRAPGRGAQVLQGQRSIGR